MRRIQKSVPLSVFKSHTTFAIDPTRINVVESLHPGCIEVRLLNYQDRETLPGGVGLVLQGNVDRIHDLARLHGRYALVAGLDEVFRVLGYFDATVILEPLEMGLGVRWELFRQYSRKTSRKSRLQKKYASLAARYLQDARSSIARITGRLENTEGKPTFYLHERVRNWSGDTPIVATTVDEARQVARQRIAKLTLQGWKCGQEAPLRGTIYPASESTVAWLCQKGKQSKWVSVEYGVPKPREVDEADCLTKSELITAAYVTEMGDEEWFTGITGTTCGSCLAEANVCVGGSGWFCGCGHFNYQCNNHMFPHAHPDYGPSSAVLHEGLEKSERWKRLTSR